MKIYSFIISKLLQSSVGFKVYMRMCLLWMCVHECMISHFFACMFVWSKKKIKGWNNLLTTYNNCKLSLTSFFFNRSILDWLWVCMPLLWCLLHKLGSRVVQLHYMPASVSALFIFKIYMSTLSWGSQVYSFNNSFLEQPVGSTRYVKLS